MRARTSTCVLATADAFISGLRKKTCETVISTIRSSFHGSIDASRRPSLFFRRVGVPFVVLTGEFGVERRPEGVLAVAARSRVFEHDARAGGHSAVLRGEFLSVEDDFDFTVEINDFRGEENDAAICARTYLDAVVDDFEEFRLRGVVARRDFTGKDGIEHRRFVKIE